MTEAILEGKKLNVKCTRCGKRDATKEDGLCDSCRYMLMLEEIVDKH